MDGWSIQGDMLMGPTLCTCSEAGAEKNMSQARGPRGKGSEEKWTNDDDSVWVDVCDGEDERSGVVPGFEIRSM